MADMKTSAARIIVILHNCPVSECYKKKIAIRTNYSLGYVSYILDWLVEKGIVNRRKIFGKKIYSLVSNRSYDEAVKKLADVYEQQSIGSGKGLQEPDKKADEIQQEPQI